MLESGSLEVVLGTGQWLGDKVPIWCVISSVELEEPAGNNNSKIQKN